jgi:hypothetical protein
MPNPFSLLSFLKEQKYAYVIIMLFMALFLSAFGLIFMKFGMNFVTKGHLNLYVLTSYNWQ